MSRVLDPFRLVLITLAGWMNQRQLHVIDYLWEENRVLRKQLGDRRLRLNDDQRRRLAAKAKRLGRDNPIFTIATVVMSPNLDDSADHSRSIASNTAARWRKRVQPSVC